MRPKCTPSPLLNDPDWLREAYKTRSTLMLAEELQTTSKTVTRRLKQFGIERRSYAESRKAPGHATPFWDRVDKSGDCWIWTGFVTGGGYGRAYLTGHVLKQAHRVAWELTNGPVPDGMFVLHNCPGGDNRLCCNPAHLFLGTHDDNMQDMVQKGRSLIGERNPKAKLTEDDVREIRRRYGQGETQAALTRAFGVTDTHVSLIVRRRVWKHVE